MGICNILYIPAAILYKNPGISREEFIELLDGLGENYPGTTDFHGGIFELAGILGLKYKKDTGAECSNVFSNVPEMFYENEGNESFFTGRLLIEPVRDEKEGSYIRKYFVKTGKLTKTVGTKFNKKVYFLSEPFIGKTYDTSDETIKIKKIHSIQQEKYGEYDEFTACVDYDILKDILLWDEFNSLEKLIKKYPYWNPDKCIDRSPTQGFLRIPRLPLCDNENTPWEKRDNRYYLKKDSLKESDYTNMIITSEAIRKKKWWLFQYNGWKLTGKFLRENEDSDIVHQKAIVDFWTSKYAEKNNLSNSEFLRYRILSGLSGRKYQRLFDAEISQPRDQKEINQPGLLYRKEKLPF